MILVRPCFVEKKERRDFRRSCYVIGCQVIVLLSILQLMEK
jgi:hypothetical protein